LTHFLENLVLPPSGPILIGVIGLLLLRRRRISILLLVIGVVSAYVCSIPFTAALANRYVQSATALTERDLEQGKPDAIVVLGGGLYDDAPEYGADTVNLRTLGRMRYAVRLARATGLPVLAVGGYAEAGAPEADLMKPILAEEFGVPIVWVENTSRNTWENAINSAPLLKSQGVDTVVLVTHAAHMPRASESFQRAGLRVIPAPTLFFPTLPKPDEINSWIPSYLAVYRVHYAMHEALGRLWYWWRSQT
jgi:uncharacterized SAM-binding protein YcdF (DUF218 family)